MVTPAHLFENNFVALSSDGKRIVTMYFDTTTQIWDAESGRKLRNLKGHMGSIWFVAFSSDEKRLLTEGIVVLIGVEFQCQSGDTCRVHKNFYTPPTKFLHTLDRHCAQSKNTL